MNYHPANAAGGSENSPEKLRNREFLEIDAWDYAKDDTFFPFDVLHRSGIKTYGMSWFDYENIVNYAAYTKGKTDTYAIAYFSRTNRSRKRVWDFRGWRLLPADGGSKFPGDLFVPAFCLGAEAAWNASDEKRNYNYLNEALKAFSGRELPAVDPARCVPVDLASYCNTTLADNLSGDGRGFTDQGPNKDLRSFPTGAITLQGIPFRVAEKGETGLAISVSSKRKSMDIPIGKPFSKLIFLHTCEFDPSLSPDLDLLAEYEINYQDGTQVKIPLLHDRNIIAWSPALTRLDAKNTALWNAWNGFTRSGGSIAIYADEWKNPNPGKGIESITLRATSSSPAQVFLLGITGEE
jgi:hypothetical protein